MRLSAVAIAAALALTACGYGFSQRYVARGGATSLEVRAFENRSIEPELGAMVTTALRSELWQREVEARPFVQFRFRPGPAAVPVNDALDDRQADAPGDAVGDRHGLDREGPEPQRLPVADGDEPRPLVQVELAELLLDEGQGQRRPVDGHVEAVEEVGEGADVVLVPVREHDAEQPVAALRQVREVRDDDVDAEVLLLGEHQPAVHGDDVVAGPDHLLAAGTGSLQKPFMCERMITVDGYRHWDG